MPQYHPTPCPQNAVSSELPLIDTPLSQSSTAQHQWVPTHAIEIPSTEVPREERPLQHRATSAIRTLKYNREDRTSRDSQASSNTMSESSISDDTRVLDLDQSNSRSCIVSSMPSPCRARARALTIASRSGFLCLEQTELRGGGRVRSASHDTPDVNAMDEERERSFRRHESPFTRRVKEKLRQAHGYNEELSSKPNQQNTELRTPTGDGRRYCELQILGANSSIPVACRHVLSDWLLCLEPLSHEQEQLETMSASCTNREVILRRPEPLKPKLLMGSRKQKLPPAPGSVMDRVRILEGQNPAGQRKLRFGVE